MVSIGGDGYRVYLPDYTDRGKKYGGRHALTAVLPASNGWSSGSTLPPELLRWRNVAYTLTGGGGSRGPILAVYWFGPHLNYWYGTTSAEKGVTSKTVRGFNRAAIANLVSKTVYKTDARRRGFKFVKSSPFKFRPAVGESIRRQWRLGAMVYDETFFSVGQVTCEILLRISERDLERLEPEIRWLYGNLGVR